MLTFTRLIPTIHVRYLEPEVEFYRAFGFKVSYESEDGPNFVSMQEGDVQFGIEASSDCCPNEANRSFLWQFQVNDLGEAVTICENRGYRFRSPKRYSATNDRFEMQIWSPNGFKLNLEENSHSVARD